MQIDKNKMVLVALDPGIRGCGVSVFDNGLLVDAEYVKSPVKKGNDVNAVIQMATTVVELVSGWVSVRSGAALVCEWPKIYTASKSVGDNNDLLALVGVDSAVAALLSTLLSTHSTDIDLHSIFPRDWKGTLKHEAVEARVVSRLSVGETVIHEWAVKRAGKTYGHNVTDAVGIGLHALGRFAPRKIIAR